MFKDSLAVSKFLRHETGSGEHAQTAVLKFLGLHESKFLRILRLQAKGVESEVTRDVFRTELVLTVVTEGGRLNKAFFGTVELSATNADGQDSPEGSRDLGNVANSRARDGGIPKEGLALNGFTGKETDSGKHTNTAMSQLGFTVTLERQIIGLGREAKRVEKANRGKGTGDGVDGESLQDSDGRNERFVAKSTQNSFRLVVIRTGTAGLATALGLKALKAEAEEARRAKAAANFILVVVVVLLVGFCRNAIYENLLAVDFDGRWVMDGPTRSQSSSTIPELVRTHLCSTNDLSTL